MALPVAQLADEFIGLGIGRGAADLRVGRIGTAIGDIVANGTVQQGGILRDHTDAAAQTVLRHLCDVLAVDANLPAVDVIETQQQVDKRGFAGARRTQPHHDFSCSNDREPLAKQPLGV